jgi:signal peptidase I
MFEGLGKAILRLIVIVVVVFAIKNYLYDLRIVDNVSMEPTLERHNFLIANKFVSSDKYKFGDILTFKTKEKTEEGKDIVYVQRLIGLPGDTISIEADILYINNEEVKEPYLDSLRLEAWNEGYFLMADYPETIIPKDSYFVMGDNREQSNDSRFDLGFVSKNTIDGRIDVVFKSLGKFEFVN